MFLFRTRKRTESKTVQAVIIAAGMGIRLRPLTNDRPKCLVQINGQPMLQRQLDAIARAGISDVVIVIGYRFQDIKLFVKKNFPTLKVRFVRNRRYAQTNTAYSLFLVRRFVKSRRVLFLHADLVFDARLLVELLKLDVSAVAIQQQKVKDWGASINNDRVMNIGPNIAQETGSRVFFTYVFTRDDWSKFMDAIETFMREKKWKAYAEFSLAPILDKIYLRAFVSDLAGVEVDTPEDAKQAERWLQKNIYENPTTN